MLTLKKPRHLTAIPINIRHNYPTQGFSLEALRLSAEYEDGNIEFTVAQIMPEEGDIKNISICCEMPESPSCNQVYFIIDRESLLNEVIKQIQTRKRRSASGDKSILDWVERRVKEYANSRFL